MRYWSCTASPPTPPSTSSDAARTPTASTTPTANTASCSKTPHPDSMSKSPPSTRSALAQLPEDFRAAIVLAEFASPPYADIAEHQGVTVATVKTRIHRARKQLATLLAPAIDP
ncbi:possible sigma factor, includes region 4 (plasmid) [Rhodococcus jostii RHA1]|uniref:Possible sigma factor, includes region 4 n=2 Tax=Rhodococcus jostii TaxID=132919 RepID=Q0RYV3_RHOJR|nr:possible sigma factor, includes region 4 [Rhodococcus jostii RHA1]